MNYADNLTYLAQYAGDSELATDGDFLAQLPAFIFSAENRILRDLDLLSARITDTSGLLTQNSRIFVLPTDQGSFSVVITAAVIIAGIRQPPLLPISKEAMDAMFPDEHAVGDPSVPRYRAPLSDTEMLVGPAPSFAYGMQVYGPQTPVTLSADNPTTFISVNLPDLMLAAEMINVSAWQRQFSAMSDDPAQSRDWNQEYERLKTLCDAWQLRERVEAAGWGTRLPNAVNKSAA